MFALETVRDVGHLENTSSHCNYKKTLNVLFFSDIFLSM